ncbi:MAG: ribosome small subunit-dependent GTPase A [Oscillospiraceae bacterium]|nr:ribosome small subunit-dependent GTPase A [Oscillospiraceae bacterium]MBQ5335966.1 ribosome small subunit-dependent GTPase A [Oscillospiraceae bacterium]MBR3024718.1 ribosome small subunit-dependent GTPase A [Oscillospiraceae bacterium]MBR3536454.1 ribosome small subunit-dependent GTPase A [Oscillospiraceae bacterium]
MSSDKTGLIIKSIGGLYTVESPDGIYECVARGIFRKEGRSPCVGDTVTFSDEKVIKDIMPRRNHIIRPPLANMDQLIFVVSVCEPSPNLLLLDKFIAIAEYKNIKPVVVITKVDLDRSDNICSVYTRVGIDVVIIDYTDDSTVQKLKSMLAGKISAFTGNSGVGKSTLLNAIDSTLGIRTGEISKKLGRGRHTTRESRLYKLEGGGYIADTPGFSTFETNKYDIIKKEELSACFTEFSDFSGNCRFSDCSHTCEKGCAVIQAVKDGIIPESRHESYCQMYEEAKAIKDWEL